VVEAHDTPLSWTEYAPDGLKPGLAVQLLPAPV
jgi:hypothetical protein